jgi:glycosyltransferase involved in cell wall biosynthesis/GT2 family glycosyltransferase
VTEQPDPPAIRISVVIPALDAWHTLPVVLDALRPQVVGEEYEVLLVESSGELSRTELERRWPWIRVLALREPVLPGEARNVGARAAAGEWLAFLDADCVPEEDWLDELERSIGSGADAVAGAILNGTPRSPVGTAGYLLEFANWHPDARPELGHAASCNLLLRRSALEELGGFAEDVFPGEDTILTVPLAASGRLTFAPGARVRHLNHTSLGQFMRHQRRLGRSFSVVCARCEFPYRRLGRPWLGPVAGTFRLLALAWRLIVAPKRALVAMLLAPLLIAGLASWTLGLITSGRGGRSGGLLFVIGSLDDHGGLQRKIGDLADIFACQRQVTIITWGGWRSPSRQRRASGVEVVRLPSLVSWDRECRLPIRIANGGLSVFGGLVAAAALRHKWGTAYASGLSAEGLVAALAAPPLGRRFVLETWLPGQRGNVARLERSPLQGPIKRALQGASAVIAGTDELAEELMRCGFPPPRVRVVPHGIPLDRFVPVTGEARVHARRELGVPEHDGLVVYHGRFDLRQKRLDLLLAGWRLARLAGWRLLLVGEGEGRSELERLRRGVPSVLPLFEWREDVRPVLDAADLFVLPTEAEAPGAAMIEAMASGLPGAVSATPLYTRWKPAGIELVRNDEQAWAEALRRLTRDPAERAARGAQARGWVEQRHDIRQTVATLESILDAA